MARNKLKLSKKGKKQNRKKARVPVRARRARGITPYQRLLVDPCQADLRTVRVAGAETGYISRFKRNYGSALFHTLGAGTANFSGYVAWFPGYHCPAGAMTLGRGMNLFGWWGSSGANPTNSAAGAPYGGSNNTSTRSSQDPAYAFLNGTTAQCGRTLAGCIQMRYIGRLDETAGEYCVLHDVSSDVLVGGLASVDDLFALANTTHRVSTKPVEVRYTPTDLSCRYRTEGISTVNNGEDRPVVSGDATASSYQGDSVANQKAIVIAFRGLQQTSSSTLNVLQWSFTKAIEWQPQAGSGLPGATTDGGGERPDAAAARLDSMLPSWRTIQTGDTPVDAIIQASHTGVVPPGARYHTDGFDLNIPAFGNLHIG